MDNVGPETPMEEKKQLKMPSAFSILLLIIAIMALLTWVIPSGEYQVDSQGNMIAGTYKEVTSNPQGIWDIFKAPVVGMIGNEKTVGAIPISLFVLIVGGFLGIVEATNTLDVGIATIVKKNHGNEKKIMLLLMFLFALGGTAYGMFEETMAFYPLIIPVLLGYGFDVLTGVSVVFLGVMTGIFASVVNPFSVGVASATAGISPGEGMRWRILFLIMMFLTTTTFVFRYAAKGKKDPSYSLLYGEELPVIFQRETLDANSVEMSKRQKVTTVLFISTFVIMILGLIPWTDINEKLTFFNQLNQALLNIPFIGQLIGKDLPPLGTWYFVEMSTLFIMMSILIGKVNHMTEDQILDNFFCGLKELMTVALVVAVARGIQVIMNDGQITATILHFGEENLQGLSPVVFVLFTFLFYIPMAFLIPSTSGLASATIGILAPLGEFTGVPSYVVIIAYLSASGMVNLITPTSAVLMGSLAIAKIEYSTWLKYMWKYVCAVFLFTCILLTLMTLLS